MSGKWKHIWIFLGIFIMMSVTSCFAAEMESAAGQRTGESTLVLGGAVSKNTAGPGDVITYQFRLNDSAIAPYAGYEDGADIGTVEVVWKSGSKKQEIKQKVSELKAETVGERIFGGEISIYKGMEKGAWRISKIRIYSNDRDYVENQYFGTSEPCNVAVLNVSLSKNTTKKEKLADNTLYENLSFSEFNVKGTGKADNKAPSLKSMSLKKRRTKKGIKIDFRIKISDKSPLKYIICYWEDREKGKKQFADSWFDLQDMMKYSKKYNCYRRTFFISNKNLSKKLNTVLCSVYACDSFGHRVVFKNSDQKYESLFKKITYPAATYGL